MSNQETEPKTALYRSTIKTEGSYQYTMAVYQIEGDEDYEVVEEAEGCKAQHILRTKSLDEAIKFADDEELPEQ